MLATMTSFADITTIAVGGEIDRFVEPTTRVGVIEAVEEADAKGLPLFVIGGGSNPMSRSMASWFATRAVRSPFRTRPLQSKATTAQCM